MPTPEKLGTVYTTDESVAIRARGDFVTLCPDWQKLAYGTDGVIDSGSPWVLTSATVNFETNGVESNHVIQLKKSGTTRASGDILAVDSVSGGSITLRRFGKDAGIGQPPTPATDIEFLISTLDPQIEEASFDLNRRFGIDPNILGKSPSYLYDMRDLRQATILILLKHSYTAEARSKDGDFWGKVLQIDQELTDVISRLQVRWLTPSKSGSNGFEPTTTNIGSAARIVR